VASALLLAPLLGVIGARAEVEAQGPVLGVEVGKAGVQEEAATVFAPAGWGRGLVVGYRFDQLGVELHVGQAFRLDPLDPAVEGDVTGASLRLTTMGVRYTYLRRFWLVSAFAGVTRARVPLLVLDEVDEGGNLWRVDLRGVGPLFGAGLGVPIPRTALQILVEGRMVRCFWEQPLDYVSSFGTAGGATTWQTSTEPLEPEPWSLVVGLRAVL